MGVGLLRASDSLLPEPSLSFIFPDEMGTFRMRSLSLSQISKLNPAPITYVDPLFGRPKTYMAVRLKDILDLGFGPQWRDSVYSDIELTSKASYKATATLYTLKDDGGYIAIADHSVAIPSTWETFPASLGGTRAGLDPGPFYLFWLGVNQTEINDYLWFWQIKSLKLMRFEDKYPRVIPIAASKGTDVYEGYMLFRDHCIRCHSMDRQGGKIGPDLGAPRNVTTYRDDKTLFGFIKKPSEFRYTKMPDFDQTLTDLNIRKIMSYLKAKAKEPVLEFTDPKTKPGP